MKVKTESAVSSTSSGTDIPAGQNEFLRIITPVRFTPDSEARLTLQIATTRGILEKFKKAGYNSAIWAVDSLPPDKEIKNWAETCLKAFPYKPILAIDSGIKDGRSTLEEKALELLFAACSGSTRAVMINYERMNNSLTAENSSVAIKIIERNLALARKVSKIEPVWLDVRVDQPSSVGMNKWPETLHNKVDGFYVEAFNGLSKLDNSAAGKQLIATRKPVFYGELVYTAPRLRPGLEQDLMDQYKTRMARYEAWVVSVGYAGYSRSLGEGIPEDMQKNMQYAP